MGIFSNKNRVVTKYPNGDFKIVDKKRGTTTEFNKIRPDGKRERDGK
jgi:hypothetical protein